MKFILNQLAKNGSRIWVRCYIITPICRVTKSLVNGRQVEQKDRWGWIQIYSVILKKPDQQIQLEYLIEWSAKECMLLSATKNAQLSAIKKAQVG